jgi:hypothetical protein
MSKKVEACGVVRDPVQRAAAVLDSGGSDRVRGEPVLDVHHGEAHLQVRHQPEDTSFLRTSDPAAPVDVNQHRHYLRSLARQVNVELKIGVVRAPVSDVCQHLVVGGEQVGPFGGSCRLLLDARLGGRYGADDQESAHEDQNGNATQAEVSGFHGAAVYTTSGAPA